MYENNGVSGLIPSVFHKLDKSPVWFGELVPLVTTKPVVVYSKRLKFKQTTQNSEKKNTLVQIKVDESLSQPEIGQLADLVKQAVAMPSVGTVASHTFKVGDLVEVLPGAVRSCCCEVIETGIYRIYSIDKKSYRLSYDDKPTWVDEAFLKRVTLKEGDKVKVIDSLANKVDRWKGVCELRRLDIDDSYYPFFIESTDVECRWFRFGAIALVSE